MEGSTPKVIENAEGMRTTPSFVGAKSDDFFFGFFPQGFITQIVV